MTQSNQGLLSHETITSLMNNDINGLNQGIDLCDEDGNTLYHLAIMGQQERLLYRQKRSRKFRPKFNKSHLSRSEAFRFLLTLDVIPKNAKNHHRHTALMEAFMWLQDSPDWALALIDLGCDIHEIFPDGNTALHWAVYNEWIEVAEVLIENGIDIDRSSLGRVIPSDSVDGRILEQKTPLHLACSLGLVDEIWMLLFYGADPNYTFYTILQETREYFPDVDEDDIPGQRLWYESFGQCPRSVFTCFDIAVSHAKSAIGEIFLESLNSDKHFSLMTFINREHFQKIREIADAINFDSDLGMFFYDFLTFNPELFKLFVEKFDYIILEICDLVTSNSFFAENKMKLRNLTENIFTLFGSHLSGDSVQMWNSTKEPLFTLDLVFVFGFYKDEIETLTRLLCFVLSYGIELTVDALDRIYYTFGFCELFRIMLYMDFRLENPSWDLVPRIYYDVKLTVGDVLGFDDIDLIYNVAIVEFFNYFASPQLVEFCVEIIKQLDYSGLDEEVDRVLKKIKTLPNVPTLVELARNKFRKYIIDQYKIEKSAQFYTVINCLPISKIHKQILTYERKLYF